MNDLPADLTLPKRAPSRTSAEPASSVSVIVVVYKTGEALEPALTSVLQDPIVTELVIVNNGASTEEIRKLHRLSATDDRITLIEGQGNVGFARGANLGAHKARGRVLVFVNPDAFIRPGCLAHLTQSIENQPVPCIVGGRVLNPDMTEQRGGRRGEITPFTAVISLGRLGRFVPAWRKYEVHLENQAMPEGVIAVPTISGACFCMRREDFDAVAGFDEGYFLHVEDVDLCWRVRQAGGKVLFHPQAEVVHLGHTSRASPMRVEFYKGMGLVRYFSKRASTPGETLAAWLLSPLILLATLARPLLWSLRPVRPVALETDRPD